METVESRLAFYAECSAETLKASGHAGEAGSVFGVHCSHAAGAEGSVGRHAGHATLSTWGATRLVCQEVSRGAGRASLLAAAVQLGQALLG